MTWAPGRHKTINVWPVARLFPSDMAEELGLPRLEEAPVPPAPPVTLESDTIRGGKFIVFGGSETLLDTSMDRSLLSTSLPMGWTTVTAGSGSRNPTLAGLELDTGLTAASVAGLQSTTTYDNFDIAIDVELVYPVGATASPVDLAVLEARTASGAIARVRLRRGWGADPALTAGFGDMVPVSGPTLTGGIVDATGATTLRIVRNEERVFAFVGVRDTDGVYSTLSKVLDYDTFPADAGSVRFYVGNVGIAGRVRTRFTNFTVRSHVLIGPRLLEDKLDLSTRRLAGNVPAATVEEVGLHDVTVFGLFGETVYPDGFEYVLPTEKTLGRVAARTLFIVQDPVLRDG